jgi:hypothetical protein
MKVVYANKSKNKNMIFAILILKNNKYFFQRESEKFKGQVFFAVLETTNTNFQRESKKRYRQVSFAFIVLVTTNTIFQRELKSVKDRSSLLLISL